MATVDRALRLSAEAITNLQSLLPRYTVNTSLRDLLFNRMEYVDRCIMREANRTEEYVKGKLAQRNGKRNVIADIEIPTVFSQIDTAHARLVGLFLSGIPVIGCTSSNPKLADGALALTALSRRDEKQFGYVPQLAAALHDSLKYLFCAVEVNYKQIQKNSIKTGAEASSLEAIGYAGNEIRRLDPYNVFFDPTVPMHEVSTRGAYAGYVEAVNYINTKITLHALDPRFAITRNFSSALSATVPNQLVKRPDCSQPLEAASDRAENWSVFWGNASRNAKSGNHDGKYEHATFYVKLIPEEQNVNISRGGTPQIFKLMWINGVLVYVEPLENAHQQLPIVVGTGNSDGLNSQSKSPAEQITDFQELLSSFVNATLKSMRRAVSDRALYDPQRIKPSDIASQNPTAKIPVKLNQFNKDLSSAYYAIPYRDEITPYFMQNFGFISQIANQTLGMNPAAQGSFIKGNRTQTEYMDVQSNSDARSLKFAMNLEFTLFGQIKQIMLMNYLQYAQDEEIAFQDSEKNVSVKPADLRKMPLSFDMTDGLRPASKTVSEDLLIAAMNSMAQMPILDMKYSRAQMFVHALKSKGLNLEQYKASPEEQQFTQALLAGAQQQ